MVLFYRGYVEDHLRPWKVYSPRLEDYYTPFIAPFVSDGNVFPKDVVDIFGSCYSFAARLLTSLFRQCLHCLPAQFKRELSFFISNDMVESSHWTLSKEMNLSRVFIPAISVKAMKNIVKQRLSVCKCVCGHVFFLPLTSQSVHLCFCQTSAWTLSSFLWMWGLKGPEKKPPKLSLVEVKPDHVHYVPYHNPELTTPAPFRAISSSRKKFSSSFPSM